MTNAESIHSTGVPSTASAAHDINPHQQRRALLLSTVAFTVCFAVWTIFSIIGLQIKTELGLSVSLFGILAPPIFGVMAPLRTG